MALISRRIAVVFVLALVIGAFVPATAVVAQPSVPTPASGFTHPSNQAPVTATGESVPVPAGARPATAADPTAGAGASSPTPEEATAAWLAHLSPEKRARSDAYFEGETWLRLWDFLLGAVIALALLFSRLSARMRDLAVRASRFKAVQTTLYWIQFLVVSTLAGFPLTVYSGYIREKQYDLATQSFAGWLGDEAKGLLLGVVFGALALMAIYAVIRRAPRTWWAWGAGVAMIFLVVGIAIAPVFIEPLFNDYTPLKDEKVRQPILSLARANGIPATDVWVVDASRQTTRVSANVAGLLGTERIALNDNLLKRCSLPEIEAVMAHEMGHYVLNHVWKMILQFGVLVIAGFGIVFLAARAALARWGDCWGVTNVADVAALPLLTLILSAFFLLATPLTNTIIRVQEAEADIYGLNAARQPDGFAEVTLKLGEYRKLAPGPLEEALFFDHPSGHSRILMAMCWKAEQTEQSTRP